MNTKVLYTILAIFIVSLSSILIIQSSLRKSVTMDEYNHYFCGLEWLQTGEYTSWPENPVFSRIIPAIGPYLKGYRAEGFTLLGEDLSIWDHFFNSYRNEYFYEGPIDSQLISIRFLTLPIFLISCIIIWFWSKRLTNNYGALITLGIYCFIPVLLGHSGLGTTDITFVCVFTLLIYLFFKWLNKPSFLHGILFGFALGLSMLTKYSVLPFFGITMAVTFPLKWIKMDRTIIFPLSKWFRSWVPSGLLATAIMIVLIWGFHGFHVGAIGNEPVIKTLIATGNVSEIFNQIIVPAPEWFAGLLILLDHNNDGHVSYMLGELSQTGFWYYYPLGISIKTPIPSLLLGVLGLIGIIKHHRDLNWQTLATFLIPFALMISVMTSHINIGVRHVAPIYPLFSLGAVASTLYLLQKSNFQKQVLTYLPVALVVWQIGVALLAFPNYTNYFNLLAGNEPGEIIADSDLDWGMGLKELSKFSMENNIDTLHMSYFGVADECLYDLPVIYSLPTDEKVKGWVAISENTYWGVFSHRTRKANTADSLTCKILMLKFLDQDKPHTYFRWLDDYELKAKLGNSIRMYYVE